MNEEDKLLKILEIETNRVNHLDTILFNIKVWTTTLVIVLIGYTIGVYGFLLLTLIIIWLVNP
ncbi:MAG: hypothetical protein CV087_21815 [Candidatus Brocadia sp. WS118]|nr:MAG: hypothetical protein CV087_21815 [Candidatus Brocadia sp. WS118]